MRKPTKCRIGQVTYYFHTRVEVVEHIAQLVFENIIANRSHYLVGVPYEGKNVFKDLNLRSWFELLPSLVKTN